MCYPTDLILDLTVYSYVTFLKKLQATFPPILIISNKNII